MLVEKETWVGVCGFEARTAFGSRRFLLRTMKRTDRRAIAATAPPMMPETWGPML